MAGRPAAAGLLAGRLLSAFIFVHDGWSIIGSYSGAVAYMQRFGVPVMLLPAVIALVSLTIWASTVALDVFCWHRPENLGSATASAAIRGYNRRARRIDGMPARDPLQTNLCSDQGMAKCGWSWDTYSPVLGVFERTA